MSAMHIHENERVYLCRGENVDIEISIHSKSRHFCPSVSEWNCLNLAYTYYKRYIYYKGIKVNGLVLWNTRLFSQLLQGLLTRRPLQ